MALICSKVEITWYDGVYPSESGALTLLGADERIDESSPLVSEIAQLVDRQEGFRWDTPNFWPRGNQSMTLEWDRIRPATRHDEALIMALEAAESMPTSSGWVKIELPDYGRAWVITPAAVSRIGSPYRPRDLMIAQRYRIEMGKPTEIALDAEEAAITSEIGTEILTEDGDFYLALETAP
jgi:hypothetical protein